MIEIAIQGRTVTAERGESLLEVIRRAGFAVPSLCHHPRLEPYGACRLCLVEVVRDGRRRLTTSCDYPAMPGIAVELDTPSVQRHRKVVLELLLARASSAPEIRELAREHGVDVARFPEMGQRCILCGLCERVCNDVVGAHALTFSGRGDRRRLEMPFGDADACIGCGACSAVCPTNCLTMERDALERMRRRPGPERLCRYVALGLYSDGFCGNDYDCASCDVHRRLAALDPTHPAFIAGRRRAPGGTP